MYESNIYISQAGGSRPSHQRVVLRGQLRPAMPKRPTEEQMERAVAAGDPPVSAKHPADEEWLAAQQNWLASRRTAARALQKHKTAARRVGRAALAPHRAPGAQAVRLICFSCGRTRPATICQAPVVSLREAGRNKPWRGTSSSSSSWIRRASHAARAATAQPAHLIALALLMPPTSVACRSSSPGRTSANKCPPPRGRARSTGRRGAAAVCPRLA